jgi:hypothetical protein
MSTRGFRSVRMSGSPLCSAAIETHGGARAMTAVFIPRSGGRLRGFSGLVVVGFTIP